MNNEFQEPLKLIPISEVEFKLFADLLYHEVGIKLKSARKDLLSGRLQKTLKSLKFNNFTDYYNFVIEDKSGIHLSNLVNNLTTNHTFFYRESGHFDYMLKRVLPELEELIKQEGQNDLRIWCSACSTGEEAYTLVMILMEHFGKSYYLWKSGILATDISEKALEIAEKGIYSSEQIKNLPEEYKNKYFIKLDNDKYKVLEKIKKEVTIRRFNLNNSNYPFKKPFHIIFCRNVMIYFDLPKRRELVRKLSSNLIKDGYLFISHSETLSNVSSNFRSVHPAVYQKI
ncbi:MAG: CheR family methyltransferase [Candidatus Sericytochromatia bacterium]